MSYDVTKIDKDVNVDSSKVDLEKEDTYFNLKVQNKRYPSCYQYNVLIMLAKRLINEDEQNQNACKNDWYLERRFAREIVNA